MASGLMFGFRRDAQGAALLGSARVADLLAGSGLQRLLISTTSTRFGSSGNASKLRSAPSRTWSLTR
jgi:hypothetical protein